MSSQAKADAESLEQAVTAAFTSLQSSAETTIKTLRETLKTTWEGIRSDTESVLQKLQSLAESTFQKLMQTAADAMNQITEKFKDGWNQAGQGTESELSRLESAVQSSMNSVTQAVERMVSTVKEALHFQWELPYLKMPHIRISGSWSMDPPSAPTFGVDWYRKAMGSGMILNHPTIFGAMNGQLLGAGEAGSETVVGTQSLLSMIRDAVTDQRGMQGQTIINVYGHEGQDIRALATEIEQRINLNIHRRMAGFR